MFGFTQVSSGVMPYSVSCLRDQADLEGVPYLLREYRQPKRVGWSSALLTTLVATSSAAVSF